jgi:ABC-type transporter Mla maintaining outer membrane lipid asymmetry ATPase subunit MlaF
MSEEAAPAPLIDMRDVRVAALRDPAVTILENVQWRVLPGEFWVVAGSEHSGKTSLLTLAAALMPPAAGSARLFGRDILEYDESHLADRLRLGFVSAEGKLFNSLTVAENIALPLRYHSRLADSELNEIVARLMELLELTPFAGSFPVSISANWRQRAALARALVLRPEILLLDNPNGGLVFRHRLWLVRFLDELWRGHNFFEQRPVTIVATTDDLQVWKHPGRKFAVLHEGSFSVLGEWSDRFLTNGAVRELLATHAPPVAGD